MKATAKPFQLRLRILFIAIAVSAVPLALYRLHDHYWTAEWSAGSEVTDEQLGKVKVGMTAAEVRAILGEPDEVTTSEKSETWGYGFGLGIVRLENGKCTGAYRF